MPDTLRTIKLAADEKLWIFNTDEAGMNDLTGDPAHWVRTNVSNCAASRTGEMVILESTNRGQTRFVFMGICGTTFIFMDGSPQDTLNFIDRMEAEHGERPLLSGLRSRLIRSMERNRSNLMLLEDPRTMFGLTPTLTSWSQVDVALLREAPHTEIEFFFFEEEQKAFIHFELGGNALQNKELRNLVRDQPGNYLKWLKGDINASVPRRAFKVPLGGNPVQVDMSRFTLQEGAADIHLVTERPGPINCIDPCIPTACDSNFGTIVSGSIDDGDLVVEIDYSVDKAYCKNRNTGEPC